MSSFMKTVQTNAIVQAVLFMVLGLVLMFVPDITLVTIVYLLAAIFAVSGLVSIFAYMREGSPSYKMSGALTTGIFLIVVALVMFAFPAAVAGFFSMLLGAVLILCGVANMVRSAGLREFGGNAWIAYTVLSLIVAIGGVVIIWNPFETTVVFVIVLGALLFVNGVSDLIVELSVRRHVREERA